MMEKRIDRNKLMTVRRKKEETMGGHGRRGYRFQEEVSSTGCGKWSLWKVLAILRFIFSNQKVFKQF